jgi:maleate isomerase
MTSKPNLYEELQKIMESLLKSTDASRTTIRLDIPELELALETVVAEGIAPGVNSLKGDKIITDMRKTVAPVMYLEEHRKILVQDDCMTAIPAPPQKLIEYYGVKAQMLAPIIEETLMIGVLSVHYNLGSRHWSEQDIAALQAAAERVEQVLQQK